MTVAYHQTLCTDLGRASGYEWLETNGIGGYASATITGTLTRRYHGLLIASLKPPTHRFVLLSKLEEAVLVDAKRFELSTNFYTPNVTHPRGFEYQTGFRLAPFPVTTFEFDNLTLEKSVMMLHGANATLIRYRLVKTAPHRAVTLALNPLLAMRDYHALAASADARRMACHQVTPRTIQVNDYESNLSCFIAHNADRVDVTTCFYRNFALRAEQARGFDFTEDLFNCGTLIRELRLGESFDFIAATEGYDIVQADELEQTERARRARELARCPSDDAAIQVLWTASEKFIVERESEARDVPNVHDAPLKLQSIIAGYHWFTDWGRDTMIALTGVTLTTQRYDSARQILLAFASYIDGGLIPNNFPDRGAQPSYNTIDATLWYIHAIGEYLTRTADKELRARLYPHLRDIITSHETGTHHHIKLDKDFLLRGGEAAIQLTWMDAKIGDYVVTPRDGRAVEIQALWFNALHIVADIAGQLNDNLYAAQCRELAGKTQTSFNRLFWNDNGHYLYDCLADDGTPDDGIRPNQIFALSLPHRILTDKQRAVAVLQVVERELLTPYGLRSLATGDRRYRSGYQGDSWTRDTSYHQGTVWTWLLGHFITAYLNTHGRNRETRAHAAQWLVGVREYALQQGVGNIAEIYEPESPFAARGCVAQAWSVAEVLRCAIEETDYVTKKS